MDDRSVVSYIVGQPFDVMRRIAISLAVGLAVALGLPPLIGLVIYGRMEPTAPTLLYWPLSLTDKSGLTDCANANLVPDKLSCAYKGLFIDLIVYPLSICAFAYLVHRLFFRRGAVALQALGADSP